MTSELEALRRENERLRARLAELEGGRDDAAFLASLLEVVPAFILRADENLTVTYLNRVRPGYTLDAVVGTSVLDHAAPESREDAHRALTQALAGQASTFRSRAHLLDGSVGYFQSYVAPLREPGGRTGVVLVAFDVSEDYAREQTLHENEQKLRVALEATGIGLWSFDARTGVVLWDERMRAITGHTSPVSAEEWLEELVHPDDRERMAEILELAHLGEMRSVPHRIVRPDGDVRWVVSHGRADTDVDGTVTHMYGGVLDITHQQQLERQTRHRQKLEAIGSLTAGVAHNFNNLLMAILPTFDLLREVVPPSHADLLADATHAAERGAELIRELMTFAGQKRRVSRVAEHPRTFVSHAVAICRRAFDSSIRLDLRLEDDLPSVHCDPGALEHALVNVMLNARDALGGRSGSVTVNVRRTPEDERRARGLDAGAWLCIEVCDDGPGIPEELHDRIFEPFFTTKGPQGTGLGLSTVYAVCREHGGAVEFDTGTEGTSFRIYLPASKDGPAEVEPTSQRTLVLLVDDEPAVRRVVRKMLEVSGFRALEAGGAREALRTLDAQAPKVVLLDRSMPGRSGRAILPELRRRIPDAKILYFTGQHIPPEERAEVDGVVQKPARMATLVEAIERALS